MKIIDFHTHIFPDSLATRAIAALMENAPGTKACTDGTCGGLLKSMRASGVTQSVLLPIATKPSQVQTINSGCTALMSPTCIPFGTLHPDMSGIEDEVQRLVSFGVKGVKLHPEYQYFYIDDPKCFPLYDALSNAGLIVVLHAGKDPGPFTCDHALPHALATVAKKFPKLKIVAAHLGGWQVWNEVENLLSDLPMYFDTASVRDFLPKEDFMRIVRKQGVEKILFGTDSPWYDQAQDIQWIDGLRFSSLEKEKIFFQNAEKLLNNTL
jgi:hypothetical protein